MLYSDRMCLEGLIPDNSIIGLESALSYYDLCTFADQYMVLLFNSNSVYRFNSKYFKFVSRKTLNPSDIIPYSPSNGRLKITTPEATICEMIACDGRDDFIIEALQSYIIFKEDSSYNEEKLFSKAKEYGVYERLKEYLDWAYEDLDDMC